MNVSDIMSMDPICCDQQSSIKHAAELMRSRSCGELPILNGQLFLVGVITDRDICCRAVADGFLPDRKVYEFMSSPPRTIRSDASVQEACFMMERHQIRRIPVVDSAGRCVGMISMADIAKAVDDANVAELVREISQVRTVSAYLG